MPIAKILLIISTLVTSQDDWPEFYKELRADCIQAQKDMTDSSFNSFMDRKLVGSLARVKNGSDKSFRGTFYLLAVYYEDKLTLPVAVSQYLEEKGKTLFDKLINIVDKEMTGN